jgi:hypothetical protein
MVKDVILEQLAIDDIVSESFEAVLEHSSIFLCKLFDTCFVNIVADGSLCS